MELHECTMGKMVITEQLEVGFVVGLTYNVNVYTSEGDFSYKEWHDLKFTNEEWYDRTIPLVEFPKGKRGVHHTNLNPFNYKTAPK